MLQRLIYRTPSPTRPPPNDKQIFNREGRLRDHILNICQSLKIDPNELHYKPLEAFEEPEIHKNVQILRYNHHESKRQTKINHVKSRLLHKLHGREKLLSLQTSPTRAVKRPSLTSSPLGLPSLAADSHRHGTLTTMEKHGSFFMTEHPTGYKSTRIMPSIAEDEDIANRKMTVKLVSGPVHKVDKRVKMIRSVSVENFDEVRMDSGNDSVKAALARDFELALQRRMREDERMVNVIKMAEQQEEEYRERMREMREKKEEQSQNVRKKVEKNKQIKIQQLDLVQKVAERRSDIEKADYESRQKRYAQEMAKVEDSERKRNQLSTERVQRITCRNEADHQRQISCIEYKIKMENEGTPDLSMIEEKLSSSAFRRKYKNFNQKHRKGGYIPALSTERLQRVKDEDEAARQTILQKIVEKMAKERNFELTRQQKREAREISPTVERALDHARRMDEIRVFEDMRDTKFVEDVKEKDLRSTERVKRNRSNVEDYISERRELWSHKIENAKNIRLWAEEEKERKAEMVMSSYKDRIEQIIKEKQDMKMKLGNAREKSRQMFGL